MVPAGWRPRRRTRARNGLDRVVGAAAGRAARASCARARPTSTWSRPSPSSASTSTSSADVGRPDAEAGDDLPAGDRDGRRVRRLRRRDRRHRGEAAVRRDAAAQHPARGPQHGPGGRASATATAGRSPRRWASSTPPRWPPMLTRVAARAGRAGARRPPADAGGCCPLLAVPPPAARLLQRLPAQPVDRRPGRRAGRRRCRLPRDHVLRGPPGRASRACRRRRWGPRACPGSACRRSSPSRTSSRTSATGPSATPARSPSGPASRPASTSPSRSSTTPPSP